MSDVQTGGEVAATIQQPAPEGAPAQDYKALYEQEKDHRNRERNLYRPVQNMLRDLDEGSIQAIQQLADAARNGDADAIVDWSLATIQTVTGASDVAAVIAARQNGSTPQALGATPPAPETPAPTPAQVNPDEVRQIVAEQIRIQGLVAQIESELGTAGYSSSDPAGQTIIRYAQQNNVPVSEAIQWFDTDVQTRAMQRAQGLAAAAAQTPATAPTGAPVGSAPNENLTPAQMAVNRIKSWNQQ